MCGTGHRPDLVDDFLIDRVLLVVDLIPPGRVAAYGDVGRIAGVGPRQVGRILAEQSAGEPWWRVTNIHGDLPPDLLAAAAPHWQAEGIAIKPGGTGTRMATTRADLGRLAADFQAALNALSPPPPP